MISSDVSLQLIADKIKSGIMVVNSQGIVSWSNRLAIELLGAPVGKPTSGLPLISLLGKAKKNTALQVELTNAVRLGVPITTEWSRTGADGQVLWIEITGSRLSEDSRSDEYLFILEDVTRRKRQEKLLRETQRRFKVLADNSATLIWVANADMTVTFTNKTWCDYVGRPMEAEIGFGWIENLHPDEKVAIVENFKLVFKKQLPFQVEYRLRKPNGTFGWLLERANPIYDIDGKFAGFVGSCFEITDRKDSEFTLLNKGKVLDRIEQELSTAISSHLEELSVQAAQGGVVPSEVVLSSIAHLKSSNSNLLKNISDHDSTPADYGNPEFIYFDH